MKTINETFTDEEIDALQKKKEKYGDKNWHDFILRSAGLIKGGKKNANAP
jgi:hypothetical protein